MYTLRLYENILQSNPSFLGDLTQAAIDWTRSIRSTGGYWRGRFKVKGSTADLQHYFDTWMGCHLEENTAGVTTWEGMIYEMDLTIGRWRYRKSLDTLWNAANATYTQMDYTGDNMLNNADFENVTVNNFDHWEEGAIGAGGVEDETVIVHGGSHAMKITDDHNRHTEDGYRIQDNSYARQNVNVTSGEMYRLKGWCDGYARVGVRNPNNPTGWVIPPTPISRAQATFSSFKWEFPGPAGNEVLVFCLPGADNGAIGYFDDFEMLEMGEVVYDLGWSQVDSTVTKYGRKEEWLLLDDYPQPASTAHRDKFLAEHCQPTMLPVSAANNTESELSVTVHGYAWTMNWQFVHEGDGEEGNLSDWLSEIVGSSTGLSILHDGTSTTAGDCQFVKAGNIASNILQVKHTSSVRQRAWDQVTELLEFGIADATTSTPDYMPVRAWVGNGRLFHYAMIDREPLYYMREDGALYDRAAGEASIMPWLLKPGVWRDMTHPMKRKLDSHFLEYNNDVWVDEVEVDSKGNIMPKPILFSETDLFAALLDYYPVQQEERRPNEHDKRWPYV